MGIAPLQRLGQFRRNSVHISGNPDLYLATPAVVPQLMTEFCQHFPTILPTTVRYDPVLKAAETSHRFVRIHPYRDGNGRVSRLLMNLVLWGHFPPVYLKADVKGRHRYAQALHRADRGNIKPLGALIALSLIEIYTRLLSALTP
jgi:Fic family protein